MADKDDRTTEIFGYQKPDVVIYSSYGVECCLVFDGDEYYGEGEPNILPRIVQNDPGIAGWHLGLLINDDLESIGRAIGSSTCLRYLDVEAFEELPRSDQQSFLMRLADNRSIEHLRLHMSTDLDSALARFLEHNTNLRSICFYNISTSFISVIPQLKMNRLARIELFRCEIDKTLAELFIALNATPGLQNLLDLVLIDQKLAREGCVALRALLSNSDCRLITLDLSQILEYRWVGRTYYIRRLESVLGLLVKPWMRT
jgi:hypothetical protein